MSIKSRHSMRPSRKYHAQLNPSQGGLATKGCTHQKDWERGKEGRLDLVVHFPAHSDLNERMIDWQANEVSLGGYR